MVAERLELSDEESGLAVVVDALVEVAGAEVVEPGSRVVQEVPGDDKDRAGNGDEGFLSASAADEAPVAFTAGTWRSWLLRRLLRRAPI